MKTELWKVMHQSFVNMPPLIYYYKERGYVSQQVPAVQGF